MNREVDYQSYLARQELQYALDEAYAVMLKYFRAGFFDHVENGGKMTDTTTTFEKEVEEIGEDFILAAGDAMVGEPKTIEELQARSDASIRALGKERDDLLKLATDLLALSYGAEQANMTTRDLCETMRVRILNELMEEQ